MDKANGSLMLIILLNWSTFSLSLSRFHEIRTNSSRYQILPLELSDKFVLLEISMLIYNLADLRSSQPQDVIPQSTNLLIKLWFACQLNLAPQKQAIGKFDGGVDQNQDAAKEEAAENQSKNDDNSKQDVRPRQELADVIHQATTQQQQQKQTHQSGETSALQSRTSLIDKLTQEPGEEAVKVRKFGRFWRRRGQQRVEKKQQRSKNKMASLEQKPLAIRNLTGRTMRLVSIERFGSQAQQTTLANPADEAQVKADESAPATAPIRQNTAASQNGSSAAGPFAAVSRVATGFWNATTSAVVPSATPKAEQQSLGIEEIGLDIEPAGLLTTDKAITSVETIKVTLELEGSGQYIASIPSTKPHSNTLSTVDDTKDEYSIIHIDSNNVLAILPTSNLATWMSSLDSNLPLSSLSIPGTHNSPTYYAALPSVRCQVVSPLAQLQNGIRFFDVRVQPPAPTDISNTQLVLVHGVFPISLTGAKYFSDLLSDIKSFLGTNPGESVIISIKREGVGNHTDGQLATLLRNHYIPPNNNDWFTEPRIPTLNEVRGKIVLLRRFDLDDDSQRLNDGRGWGIDAAHWTYNTRHDAREHVVVQDFCEVLETEQIDDKIGTCCEFLDACSAALSSPSPLSSALEAKEEGRLHLNFLSASNFWRVGCWPDKIAARLNPAMLAHLCGRHGCADRGRGRCTGVVVCDWVGSGSDGGDWDLVSCIVSMNGQS